MTVTAPSLDFISILPKMQRKSWITSTVRLPTYLWSLPDYSDFSPFIALTHPCIAPTALPAASAHFLCPQSPLPTPYKQPPPVDSQLPPSVDDNQHQHLNFCYSPRNISSMASFFHKSSGGPREEQRRRTEVSRIFVACLRKDADWFSHQIRRMFRKADKNKDGQLTREEWRQVLNASGVPTTM